MNFIKKYYKVVIWMLFIFALSSIPNARINQNNDWDLVIRKIAHLTEYAVLFILVNKSIEKENFKHKFIISLIIVVLYASSDEFHQGFVEGRGPAVKDVFIDILGGLIGAVYLKTLWGKTPEFIKKILV
ncbi:VanZ family protein [bacterium]|nr:VanZ family protein [bacterium]